MAGGGGQAKVGRGRNLDGEINLVPFIDLLSMCICFLLMTAIWVEVGAIPLHQLLGTEASTGEPFEIQVKLQSPSQLEISIEQQGRVVQRQAVDGDDFDQLKSRLSSYVGQLQSAIVQKDPATRVSARVVPASSVDYGSLIAILDILRGYGISALAVVPVGDGK